MLNHMIYLYKLEFTTNITKKKLQYNNENHINNIIQKHKSKILIYYQILVNIIGP